MKKHRNRPTLTLIIIGLMFVLSSCHRDFCPGFCYNTDNQNETITPSTEISLNLLP